MSQTPFSEFSDYLETNEIITEEHITTLTSTSFKDVILEEVIETAVTLVSSQPHFLDSDRKQSKRGYDDCFRSLSKGQIW